MISKEKCPNCGDDLYKSIFGDYLVCHTNRLGCNETSSEPQSENEEQPSMIISKDTKEKCYQEYLESKINTSNNPTFIDGMECAEKILAPQIALLKQEIDKKEKIIDMQDLVIDEYQDAICSFFGYFQNNKKKISPNDARILLMQYKGMVEGKKKC